MGREAKRLTSWPRAMVIPEVWQRCGAALSPSCEWEASHTAQLKGAVPGHFGTQHHTPEELWSACDFFFQAPLSSRPLKYLVEVAGGVRRVDHLGTIVFWQKQWRGEELGYLPGPPSLLGVSNTELQ